MYAEHNQACIISPFILAGVSPVTVAGPLRRRSLKHCRVWHFLSTGSSRRSRNLRNFRFLDVDGNGAPTLVRPKKADTIYVMAALLVCRGSVSLRWNAHIIQISRSQALTGGHTSSNYASWRPFCPSRCRLDRGGLALSYEKLILDADQLGMMEVYANGVDMSENGQALTAFAHQYARRSLSWKRSHLGKFRIRFTGRRQRTVIAMSNGWTKAN